jgi:hypothetical protein
MKILFWLVTILILLFVFGIPLIGALVALETDTIDEKKYGIEGARYLDGK